MKRSLEQELHDTQVRLLEKGELCDGLGRKVPKRLREIFVGARRMDVLLAELQRLRTKFGLMTHEPCARKLDYRKLTSLFNQITVLVSQATPLLQCDCDERVQNCPKCNGTRWCCGSELVSAGLKP